ncbi:hypothetical protein T492DRAFT_190032 [Pavlovales sp. CCMP2436]|nr:hypothetical protein T492DRAFT_190032 [Pavlovales sp. CCMP2436]
MGLPRLAGLARPRPSPSARSPSPGPSPSRKKSAEKVGEELVHLDEEGSLGRRRVRERALAPRLRARMCGLANLDGTQPLVAQAAHCRCKLVEIHLDECVRRIGGNLRALAFLALARARPDHVVVGGYILPQLVVKGEAHVHERPQRQSDGEPPLVEYSRVLEQCHPLAYIQHVQMPREGFIKRRVLSNRCSR